jgi:hypothetical protein
LYIHHHSPRPLSVFFIAFAQGEKPPWGAELGFELRPAIQQASALPTELCTPIIGLYKTIRKVAIFTYLLAIVINFIYRINQTLKKS